MLPHPISYVLHFSHDCSTLGRDAVIFEHVEWDEFNLDHATRRLTADEIEPAIWNADSAQRHRRHLERCLVRSVTDGGKHVLVVVQVVGNGVRPITGWEE